MSGKPVSSGDPIPETASIQTGTNSSAVLVIGDSAYLVGASTQFIVESTTGKGESLIKSILLEAGRLLAVFGKRRSPVMVRTRQATIGIRGTGIYLESEANQTYLCTCYGTVDVQSVADASSFEKISARHHDRPVYIQDGKSPGQAITDAPFKNHTDKELALIESLVGRQPPFVFPLDDYASQRRPY